MSKSHGYGSETMGTGTNFRILISMGTGTGKGTTSMLRGAVNILVEQGIYFE